jgi:anti-anti-sigma factor
VSEKSAEPSAHSGGSRSILQEQTIVTPQSLDLTTRREFRAAGSALIELTAPGTGRFVIDCSQLKAIDSTGLNTLILLHRKATMSRVRIFLRDASDELRASLVLTKTDDLFEYQNGPAR